MVNNDISRIMCSPFWQQKSRREIEPDPDPEEAYDYRNIYLYAVKSTTVEVYMDT